MGRAERKRWAGNDAARELLQEARNRNLLPEEIEQLRTCYTGYGGLSTWNQDQHFTPPLVCKFVIDLLGIQDGKVLEASCGSGAFIQELPDTCEVTGYELMQETAQVAQLCNPTAEIIQGNALEYLEGVAGKYDWAIGNPPFASFAKKNAPPGFEIANQSNRLEWYFVEMSYRALKPGGMLALVVPNGILSNSKDLKCRQCFLNEAWYRATIDLPPETFAFSGTSVHTSVIVIQKPLRGYRLEHDDYQVFMAVVKEIGWDSRRRETGKCELSDVLAICHEEYGGLDARHLAKPYLATVTKPASQINTEQNLFDIPVEPFVVGDQMTLF